MKSHHKKSLKVSCLFLAIIFLVISLYLFLPIRTNFLILGIDRSPSGTALGRSDTSILVTIIPLKPHIGMLSIPRDLWISIPEYGENRINTIRYFAEIEQPGTGTTAVTNVIQNIFRVNISYYVRFLFDGFCEVIDIMGGVDIELIKPTAIYPAGRHHLNGKQSLAFVRDRKGIDDFSRMEHTQLFVMSVFRQMLKPSTWPRLPAVVKMSFQIVDTNIPIWQLPRIGFAFIRAGPNGVDNRTLQRNMIVPFVTTDDADVLIPNWDLINCLIAEMFGS